MSNAANPTHTHYTQYADPVVRHPSPASSVGTTYGADQTSVSDSEQQISQAAFERKTEIDIDLHLPRQEELRADMDPLVLIPVRGGKPVRYGECKLEPHEEKHALERNMASLRAEVAKLQDDALFEQILLRGSKAALEAQPVTSDIDALMRSMMGSSLSIGGAHPHLGKTAKDDAPPRAGQELSNGPWNNFGEPVARERRESLLAGDSFLSGTTAGKRSRNGTARKL